MNQEASVLPVYLIHWNAPEWLASSVRSVLGSQGVSVRLIVIDNGQEQGSNLRDLLPSDIEIVPTERNMGFAGGSNLALAHWASHFPECPFAVVGSHDLHVFPDTFWILVNATLEHPVYGVIAPFTLDVTQDNTASPLLEGREHNGPHSAPEDKEWVPGFCMLLRASCVNEIGVFDERFGSYVEDVDLCYRARRHGWKVGVVPSALSWSLGRISPHAWEMIEANWVLLMLKHEGLLAAMGQYSRVALWSLRSFAASIAPWRKSARRRASRVLTWQHLEALRRAAQAMPLFIRPQPPGRYYHFTEPSA